MPLNVTRVAVVKLPPRMSTLVPTAPLVGVNELIVGAALMTVNEDELQALPPDVATETLPVVAPLGTVAWISVSESTVRPATAPLNVTEVAPVKFAPRMSTLVPTGPLRRCERGDRWRRPSYRERLVAGAGAARRRDADGTACCPAGHAGMDLGVGVDRVGGVVPLKATAVAPVKFQPRMSTLVPTAPLVGVNELIATPVTVKEGELQALPPDVATEILPLSPPLVRWRGSPCQSRP